MIKCGIDIGGTNIKFGFFNDKKLFFSFNIKTPTEKDKVLPEIIKAVKEKKNSNLIEKFVVCIPGVIKDNIVIYAPNTNIVGLNIYDSLSKAFNVSDILIENDANLAALAEARATNTKDLVMITLGTGLGAGIIIDGKLYNKHGFAGEVGHIKVEFGPYARHCGCGRYGCVEAYCSAKNMVIEYNKKHKTELNSKELFDLYQENDPDAVKNVEHFSRYLGVLIANINTILAINEFRIGGGLSLASDLFLDKVIKYYKMNTFDGLKDVCNIKKAFLDNHAGIYAAMYL
jgi:glucokinase